MRKEIEVKAKVDDLDGLIKNLGNLGIILSESIIQKDETFVDDNYGAYDQFQPGKNALRIRNSNGKFLFTIKQPIANELDCIERETEISDPKEFREALILMGYNPVVRINKTRRKAKYKDYEICVDQVEGLGDFVEMEKLTEDEDPEVVQNEMFALLESFGIKKENRIPHGYDTLVYKKENNLA
jgi:adenylate cyclase, class 2